MVGDSPYIHVIKHHLVHNILQLCISSTISSQDSPVPPGMSPELVGGAVQNLVILHIWENHITTEQVQWALDSVHFI